MFSLDVSKYAPVPYVSLADVSAQDHSSRDRQFPGLHNDTSYLWGNVDTANGKRYKLERALSPISTYSFHLWECSDDKWTYPKAVRAAGIHDMYWGSVIWLDDAGKSTMLPLNHALLEEHPIAVELGPDRYVWQDDGVIDLVFTPLPMNVLTLYVPGLPDDVGYTSTGCAVSGTIDGSEVTGGIAGLDRMYVEPGLTSHVCKTFMLEHYWLVWYSLMDDGSWQTGNLWLGEGNFATGMFNRQGEAPVIATNDDVTSTIPWESHGDVSLPQSATFSFGGHTFDWQFTHNAVNDGPSASVAHLYGTVEEVGGPKPVQSWSTMEIVMVRAGARS
jgi:hypothetical protein